MFTGELRSFSLAEILVLAGTAGAGGMAPPASTMISASMKCVQGHSSRVNVQAGPLFLGHNVIATRKDNLQFRTSAVLATLRMQHQPVFHCSSLSTLDPSNGREIPAVCHATGV